MSRFLAVWSSLVLLAGCGESVTLTTPTTSTTPTVVDKAAWPSLSHIEFEVYTTDGSKLLGAAKAREMLEVRGHCALSDTTRNVAVLLAVRFVGRSRGGRLTIHGSAHGDITGDDPSHLPFTAAIAAPAQPGAYTLEVVNSLRQEQRFQVPLRVE